MTKILQDLRPLRHFDQRELLIAAFRYYLGRMTISTCFFARALAKAWGEIEEGTCEIISKELEEAFKQDDEMRADPACSKSWYPLGHDCDRTAWEEVRQQYAPRLKKIDRCKWTYHDSHEYWSTGCGHTVDAGDLACEEVKICPHCGKETSA